MVGISFKIAKSGTRYVPKLSSNVKVQKQAVGADENGGHVPGTKRSAGFPTPKRALSEGFESPPTKRSRGEVSLRSTLGDFRTKYVDPLRRNVPKDAKASFAINLFPDGFSIDKPTEKGKRTPAAFEVSELHLLPYDRNTGDFLRAIDGGWIPSTLLEDIPCKYIDGCVVCELRDYRNSLQGQFGEPLHGISRIGRDGDWMPIVQRVVLQRNSGNIFKDLKSMDFDGWTYRECLELEARLINTVQSPLCLDPTPDVAKEAYITNYNKLKYNILYGRYRKTSGSLRERRLRIAATAKALSRADALAKRRRSSLDGGLAGGPALVNDLVPSGHHSAVLSPGGRHKSLETSRLSPAVPAVYVQQPSASQNSLGQPSSLARAGGLAHSLSVLSVPSGPMSPSLSTPATPATSTGGYEVTSGLGGSSMPGRRESKESAAAVRAEAKQMKAKQAVQKKAQLQQRKLQEKQDAKEMKEKQRKEKLQQVPPWQEAALVLLIVVRVAVAMAIRGLCGPEDLAALMLLVACAWSVESSGRECGTSLIFRATQAPGILLGAMTPPLLMTSRLAPAPDLPRARVEFWSSIACSSALLARLFWESERERGSKREVGMQQRNGCRFETSASKNQLSSFDPGHCPWDCRSAGAVIGLVLLAILQLGFASGVSWCVVIACGSVFIFRSFLQAFPCCTSAGEAMLVAHGVSLYLSNSILEPLWIRVLHMVRPESAPVENVDPVLAIVHAIVLGMLLVPVLYRILMSALSLEVVEKKEAVLESVPRASLFCFTVVAVVFWLAPAWLRVVGGVPQHPVLWVLRFLMDQPVPRVGLCVYWVVVIGLFLHQLTLRKQMARIMIRKAFHIMAVVMFVPALAFQADFLRISLALAFGVFVLVEAIRVWRIPPLGEKIHSYLKHFTDSRDSDVLIISHFSLLLGCAIPVWLSSTDRRPLAAYAGIVSLGIGDTMASVVGYNFGSMRLSRWSKKTWEGTIAGILSIVAASVLLSYIPPAFPLLGHIGSMAVAAIGAGLLEAFTTQLDNAFVPIVYYSLLSL